MTEIANAMLYGSMIVVPIMVVKEIVEAVRSSKRVDGKKWRR